VTKAIVAFGANLGEPKRMFAEVRKRFADAPDVASVIASSLYRTVPVGGPTDQPAFLNGAFAVETSLAVDAFFSLMRKIEADLGRKRKEAWGPRTIDLDLVLFGGAVHTSPSLATPHPRMHFRRFVLAPAAVIAADAVHPLLGETLCDLHCSLVELTDGRRLLAVVGADVKERTTLAMQFQQRFTAGKVVALPPGAMPGTEIVHAGAIVGVRPSVHLPGVEDHRLERDLDRVWEAADNGRLWIATSAEFHPGVHPPGEQLVPAVDLRGDSAEARRKEFTHFIDSLAEPVRVG
jgi:2-amino-4-hydroxy-6-hydroxymethyldihydropteridine diphosphokinase